MADESKENSKVKDAKAQVAHVVVQLRGLRNNAIVVHYTVY